VCQFSEHFSKAYSCNNAERSDWLKSEFERSLKDYCGMPINDVDTIVECN